MQHDRKIRSGDLNHFRDGKPREAVSTELKMVHAQKATGQTLGQSVNAGFMGFQSNTSGSSNQYSNVDQMTSTKNEVGVLSTLNSGLGTSPHHILQMQQNDSKNIRSGDLDHYRAFIGNQSAHSGTIGRNSAQLFNSQQHNLNKPPEFEKPSWLASYHTPYEQLQAYNICILQLQTAQVMQVSRAVFFLLRQVISQNATPSRVLGSNMFSQRTAAPQVSWVDSGLAGNNAPFPKRLGVEFNLRNSLQTSQRHLSPMGTSLQTTSTGQVCQFPDKGSTRVTDNVLRPPIGRTDGASVSYPVSSQEPFFAHGQVQNALI
ncbi:hypothetical protein L1987_53215 [Smallanthus sonchifolius]|uniref:Uncharacterized protein n=1 Tax=Smallanthus sonchifolius TaxID=185202 RepID=A0ACB9EUS1_9ASTR|nr:hypothetical protein L1987_53215 [Smallanthus sonchifolius]